MKKIKIFEMFSGYGGASFALKKANIPFECVGYSEIDKYAIQCYEQNHFYKSVYSDNIHDFELKSKDERYLNCINYGDCTKINPGDIPDFDLLTGGFPCQSFSNAGKGLGELDTRGTLFNEIIRIAEVKKPKYMLLENVKGLTTKRHKATFDKIITELVRIGYYVYWKILNSEEHGIPQNRERVFFVCLRKDNNKVFIDFPFPEKEELKIFLKDILEDDVDQKYYLSEKRIKLIMADKRFGSTNKITPLNGVSQCLSASMGMGGGYEPKILIDKNSNYYMSGKIYSNGDCGNANRIFKPSGTSQSIQSQTRTKILNDAKVRKLTPKECFRLMGFLNDEIKLDGLSNSQRYKLAGNGWDINLVSKRFEQMFK